MGIVTKSNKLIEFDNISETPTEGFMINSEDLWTLFTEAKATWHTHPQREAIPSESDIISFKNYPELTHFIIGEDGIQSYQEGEY